MAEKHLKKNSNILSHLEKQMKTTLRFQLTQVRMAKIKISGHSKYWQGCGERGTPLHCWWDCKLVQPLWKSVWWFLRKLDIGSSNTTPGHIPKNIYFGFSRQGFSVQPWLSQNSLCRPGWPRIQKSACSASRVLGLKACATMPSLLQLLIRTHAPLCSQQPYL